MRSRRAALRAGAAGAAAGVLSACSTGQEQSGQPARYSGPQIEVVFMRDANASLAAAYNAQADAFNQKQSKLKGRFEGVTLGQGETWAAKLTALIATDSAPDCFLVNPDILPSFGANGTLLVLDPFIKRDAKEVNTDDIFPSHLAVGKWQGKQVAITPDGCVQPEYYNVTLFQEAGVPTPKAGWTWNDYLDAARRLTKKDGSGQVTQAGAFPIDGSNQLWMWLWSNGTDLLSNDFKQVRLTEPAAIEGIQFAVDMVQKHGVTPNSPGVNLGANPQVAGKVAMWRANRGFFGNLQQVNSFKFNVIPIARSPRTGLSATFTAAGNIAIARSNKHPDAAWEWHKFLTSADAMIIRSKVQQGGCPSRKSATMDPSYMSYGVPALESLDGNKAFFDVLSDPKMSRFLQPYVGMNDAAAITFKYVTAAMKGEQSVPAAMDSAKREIEDLLRRQPQPAS